MTTRYQIIQAWATLSQPTDEQFDTVKDFVHNRLICENDKELDDIKAMIATTQTQRDFLRSKITALQGNEAFVSAAYSEPQPTDQI